MGVGQVCVLDGGGWCSSKTCSVWSVWSAAQAEQCTAPDSRRQIDHTCTSPLSDVLICVCMVEMVAACMRKGPKWPCSGLTWWVDQSCWQLGAQLVQ